MRYLLLIYGNEQAEAKMSPAEQEVNMKSWWEFDGWLTETGWKLGGEALLPTPSATTVRESGGKVMTVDGPFAETKEQLGGFYLVDCPNLDDAIKVASRMPMMGRGSVEIRPVMEFDENTGAPKS